MLKSKHVANTMLIEWYAACLIVVLFLLLLLLLTDHPTTGKSIAIVVVVAVVATFVAARIGASLLFALRRIAAGFQILRLRGGLCRTGRRFRFAFAAVCLLLGRRRSRCCRSVVLAGGGGGGGCFAFPGGSRFGWGVLIFVGVVRGLLAWLQQATDEDVLFCKRKETQVKLNSQQWTMF